MLRKDRLFSRRCHDVGIGIGKPTRAGLAQPASAEAEAEL